jgi:hypothetical protein
VHDKPLEASCPFAGRNASLIVESAAKVNGTAIIDAIYAPVTRSGLQRNWQLILGLGA